MKIFARAHPFLIHGSDQCVDVTKIRAKSTKSENEERGKERKRESIQT